jgi:DeoR family transcriptional regulator of aga operon
MFAEERLLHIVEMISRNGKVTVAELSEALGVSTVTIRRDLERLEAKELLLRTHGGAMTMNEDLRTAAQEKTFSEKEEAYAAEKERIADAAARLVEDGDAIMLTPGTTNMLLARKLAGKKELTIVTNAANIAAQIGHQPGWDVILTGGNMRPKSFALVGALAEHALSRVRADKLFLGVDGLDFEHGLTTPNFAEASVNRSMIAVAKNVIVVADRSKFHRVTFSRIAALEVTHTVITDHLLPKNDAQRIRELDIHLILA